MSGNNRSTRLAGSAPRSNWVAASDNNDSRSFCRASAMLLPTVSVTSAIVPMTSR